MMKTPTLRPLDLRLLNEVFEMSGGYVLDFSNATFAEFFTDELGVDIYEDRYAEHGGSKAKRLRCFLRTSSPDDAARAIAALWEYRETIRQVAGRDETSPNAERSIAALVKRLGGGKITIANTGPPEVSAHAPDPGVLADLRQQLIALGDIEPQPRGYAFERFLSQLFDAVGLGARASFRLEGEQIDGSFELGSETYLLEAKWTNAPIDAAELRAFNAKVEDKARWSRGLFVSQSGFTEPGLSAFGRGKSIVCMDGLDLYEILNRPLDFREVLALKVRRAAETGRPFMRVRDLFPGNA